MHGEAWELDSLNMATKYLALTRDLDWDLNLEDSLWGEYLTGSLHARSTKAHYNHVSNAILPPYDFMLPGYLFGNGKS